MSWIEVKNGFKLEYSLVFTTANTINFSCGEHQDSLDNHVLIAGVFFVHLYKSKK